MNETAACTPVPVDPNGFNPSAQLPYGLTTDHIRCAMDSFTSFLQLLFESNKPVDKLNDAPPKPFRFRLVVGAEVTKEDWKFSGRSATSRRTITASISKTGYTKMLNNWIYKASASEKGSGR